MTGWTPRFDFRTAYVLALATSVVASLLTIVYVGSGHAAESNPLTAALIETVGMTATMALRTLAVVAVFNGYYAVASAVGAPRAGVAFAWLGAAINALDAAGNVLVALVLGPAGVPAAALPAVGATLVVGAVALAVAPPGNPFSAGWSLGRRPLAVRR